MKKESYSFLNSMGFALQGFAHALKSEKHFKVHVPAAVIVFTAAALLELSVTRWLFLLVAVTLVISAELMNTAIEAVVDLVSPEQHPLAKIAKDTAAAAVLVTAVFAFIVGVMVFYGPILTWIGS